MGTYAVLKRHANEPLVVGVDDGAEIATLRISVSKAITTAMDPDQHRKLCVT